MTPDHLRIAVRPRTILECLDLACIFSVRRGLGIVVALLLGVVPMAWINVVLIGPETAARMVPSWPFWLALQTPWAMAPLTLFLGRAMFSDQLRSAEWRGIVVGLAGAVLPLLVYQSLLRGMAMLVILPFPFLLVAFAFVDLVILLERVPTVGVLRRSLALVTRTTGRILLAVCLEMPILLVGWCLVGVALDQLASLWSGHPVMAVFDADAPDWNIGPALFTYRGQIACWSVMALITVFRFMIYLDTRIRTEGWDVELKLRNPATYAGLERWRGAAAPLVLIASFATPPAAAAPVSSGPAVLDGEENGDADGIAARDAVVRERFPWYDAGDDRYRPVVDSRAQESASPWPEWGLSLPAFGTLVKGVMIVVLFAAVAGIAWALLRHGFVAAVPEEIEGPSGAVVFGEEQLDTLPEQARTDVDNLLPRIGTLVAEGDHAGAAILYHAWQLVTLHAGGVIELAKGKTNRRYAADVAERAPQLAELFRRTARLSEQARFGRLPVSAADFAAVWEQRQRFPTDDVEATP